MEQSNSPYLIFHIAYDSNFSKGLLNSYLAPTGKDNKAFLGKLGTTDDAWFVPGA
jgi:hypothetical protein